MCSCKFSASVEGGKFRSLLCHNLEVPVDIFSEPTLGFIDFYYCFSVLFMYAVLFIIFSHLPALD